MVFPPRITLTTTDVSRRTKTSLRYLQSKRHRTQVMITVTVTRPTTATDGILAIQEHVEWIPAERASANRLAGTLCPHAVSLTAPYFKDCQLCGGGIVDQIIEKMQPETPIQIQMDNAPPHTGGHNVQMLNHELNEEDVHVEYTLQPPN